MLSTLIDTFINANAEGEFMNLNLEKEKVAAKKKKNPDTVTMVTWGIRVVLDIIFSVIVAKMAWACSSSIFVALLALLFPQFFFIYYALAGSKCAAYWA